MNSISLGETVRLLRTRQHLSQTELGRRTALSRNTIAAVERDETNLTLDTLTKIMAALGAQRVALTVTPSDLPDVTLWRSTSEYMELEPARSIIS